MPASPARPRPCGAIACLACAALLPAAAGAQTPADVAGSEGAVTIPFEMPFDGQASIILYRPNGHVLRPLAQLLELKKGRWQLRWDGLDLWGHLLPAGTKAVARVIISPGLKATYEFSAAAPNRIPWLSRTFGQGEARRTGGWLGDHSPPWCIVGLWHRIFIGCPLAEHGHNIIYTNLDGEKMWGGKLRGWSGPEYLTTDGRHVYCIGRNRTSVSRTDLGADRAELLVDTKGRRIEAMAVREGRIYLTLPPKIRPKPDDAEAVADLILEVRDAETGALLDEIDHPGVRSMTRMVFDADGRCYSLVGTKLCRTVIHDTSVEHAVLNDKELRRPISLAVDPTMGDRVAVGDEQRDAVFVFDTGGKLLLTIGGVGPRKRGPWDPNTVDRPMGLTFDYRGRIWIAENYFTPKRVSRFAADGAFEEVFYGPPQYGGGGFLDPNLKSFYYRACEYALDWEKGTSRLANLNDVQYDPHSPDVQPNTYVYTKVGRPVYYRSRRYVVGDVGYQYNPGFVVCLLDGPVWRPCAVLARAEGNVFLLRKACWRGHWSKQALAGKSFIWCDRNDDGQYQAEEVELFDEAAYGRKGPFTGAYWGNRCGADLTFWGPNARLAPSRFTKGGVPIYEKKDIQPFSYGSLTPRYPSLKWGTSDVSQAAHDGSLVIAGQPFRVGPDLKLVNGEPHAKPGDYVPPVLGQQYGGLSFVGNVVTDSPAGEVGVLNGSSGVWYVVGMSDGLLLGTFFTGSDGSWSGLYPKRGMDVTGRKHDGETFFGDFIRAHNGKYYAVAGKGFHAICRIDGLDDYRVAQVSVEVTAEQLALNGKLRPILAARAKALREIGRRRPSHVCGRLVKRTSNFALDGALGDWGDVAKMPAIGRPEEKLHFDVACDDKALYVAYSGLCVLGNASEDPRYIFTTGFCLDVKVRPDPGDRSRGLRRGDVRIVFGRHKGKWVAMLYDYVKAKDAAGEGMVFTSPVARTPVGRIVQLPPEKARIAFRSAGAGQGEKQAFTAEVAVAWDALGLTVRDDLSFLADFGILGADSGGIQTARRAHWSSPSADEVTDVAVEARISPDTFGTLRLRP